MNKNLHSTKKVATYATHLESTASLAQLVEHNTFNVGVLGSSPRRITNKTLKIKQLDKNLIACFLLYTSDYSTVSHLL